jgi:dTDP-4-amino-4,6-dideoxygalactose transaminase
MASTIGHEMILMNDFQAEPMELRKQMVSAVVEVIESGSFILGQQVEKFEREWARLNRVQHCVGVGNGMDAIEISLRALDIGQGDEVITTPITAFATVLAIIRAGATPVFADIHPDTAVLDPKSVERCLTRHTKAIVLVHLYGRTGPIEELLDLAREREIHLIEDCAQAHSGFYKGLQVGSFGTFGAWSFYPTKNLGAIGDAGALTTSHEELASRARALRHYGQTLRAHHPEPGLNSRLDEIQAAALLARLPYLSVWTERRRAIARQYQDGICHPQIRFLTKSNQMDEHVYHLFVIRCLHRNALQSYLRSNGIESLVHYPIPAHQQQPCRKMQCDPMGLKHAERHSEECLSIPCHPQMKDDEVKKIISVMNTFPAG